MYPSVCESNGFHGMVFSAYLEKRQLVRVSTIPAQIRGDIRCVISVFGEMGRVHWKSGQIPMISGNRNVSNDSFIFFCGLLFFCCWCAYERGRGARKRDAHKEMIFFLL